MRWIVSDTGPLLHLHEATLLSILEHAGTIVMPKAVDHELTLHVRDWYARKPQWITVTTVERVIGSGRGGGDCPGAPAQRSVVAYR